MVGSLLGKLAFVTGAGSGIGRATCQVLAREGATIVAADKNGKAANETIKWIQNLSDAQHTSLVVNVENSKSIKSALSNILDTYKDPPTVIVNSAGIIRNNLILSMSEEDFQEVIDVNLKGSFLVMQTFAQAISERTLKNASIINIGSIIGKYGNIGQGNYCASKAGVELITKTAAKEFGGLGIRCNAVLPGLIITPMSEAIPENDRAAFLPLIALKRFGKPEEVAEMIAFLASDKSSYVNGASIEVTGGF